MKTFKKIGLTKILLPLSILFLASCAATPDVRLSVAEMTMTLEEPAYRVTTVAVSSDGKYITSGDVNGDVTLWDISNGKLLWKKNGHKTTGAGMVEDWVVSSAFTLDGKNFLTGGGNKIIRVWDVESGNIKRNLEGHEGNWFSGTATIFSINVSSDSKNAVTAGGDGTFRLWDIESGMLIKTLKASDGYMGGATVYADLSSDNKYTLSGGGDGTLRLWDNDKGTELLKVEAHWKVDSVVLNKNGKQAFSGGIIEKGFFTGQERELKFWNLETGNMIWRVDKPHGNCYVNTLSVSKDGKYLLSGGCEFVKLWDVQTGSLLKSYKGASFLHSGFTGYGRGDGAIFHPNDKMIITKGIDASVRIKDLNTDEETALFVNFRNGEWLVITSEGYYNSSEKGAQYLSVKVGEKSYSVDNFTMFFTVLT